jgi:radical SAM superfamily enzyme YgiQ (UPF0313 family)
VPLSIAEIEKAIKRLLVLKFLSKKDKKKLKKGKTSTLHKNSSYKLVVDNRRLILVETLLADNSRLSLLIILPKESLKGIEQSIFKVKLLGSKQTDTILEIVKLGESRNSNKLLGARYYALLRASYSSRQSRIENFTYYR